MPGISLNSMAAITKKVKSRIGGANVVIISEMSTPFLRIFHRTHHRFEARTQKDKSGRN